MFGKCKLIHIRDHSPNKVWRRRILTGLTQVINRRLIEGAVLSKRPDCRCKTGGWIIDWQIQCKGK
jgi:hypothetical protein